MPVEGLSSRFGEADAVSKSVDGWAFSSDDWQEELPLAGRWFSELEDHDAESKFAETVGSFPFKGLPSDSVPSSGRTGRNAIPGFSKSCGASSPEVR